MFCRIPRYVFQVLLPYSNGRTTINLLPNVLLHMTKANIGFSTLSFVLFFQDSLKCRIIPYLRALEPFLSFSEWWSSLYFVFEKEQYTFYFICVSLFHKISDQWKILSNEQLSAYAIGLKLQIFISITICLLTRFHSSGDITPHSSVPLVTSLPTEDSLNKSFLYVV